MLQNTLFILVKYINSSIFTGLDGENQKSQLDERDRVKSYMEEQSLGGRTDRGPGILASERFLDGFSKKLLFHLS